MLRTGNDAEKEAIETLTDQGWEVYKRGWPDLLAVRGDLVRLVEVKPSRASHLKKDQADIAAQLRKLGLEVEIFTPRQKRSAERVGIGCI